MKKNSLLAETKPMEQAELLIISLGSLFDQAKKAALSLEKKGLKSHVNSLRWAWPLDDEFLTDLCSKYEMILFVEEGMARGGVGEYLGSLLMKARVDSLYLTKAVPDCFPSAANRKELISMMGLDSSSLVKSVMEKWDELRFEKVVDQVRQNKWTSKKL
jgi:1-deoxy-D-xylulose-5-phosphate synthase